MLVIHALEEQALLEGVHGSIEILIPHRIDVVVDDLRAGLGDILDEHADVRVALPAQRTLDILDIDGLVEVHTDDADGRLVLGGAVERAGHVEWLPLGGHAEAARLAPGERPPVAHALAGRRPLRLEEVVETDAHVADDGVLEEVAVVDDLDGDRARVPVRAEELLCRLPDRRQRVLDERRRVDPLVRAEVDFAVRVDVLGERAQPGSRGVELLRLVDDEANDADGRVGHGVEDACDRLRLENRIECPADVSLACTGQHRRKLRGGECMGEGTRAGERRTDRI